MSGGLRRDVFPVGDARRAASPVRIVHVGIGAFHRAHQAWYTDAVDSGRYWGIAGFTGRRPGVARTLQAQEGLYHLVERTADGDRASLVASISEVADGADVARMAALLTDPATSVVTLTVTEAGYRLREDGTPDVRDPVVLSDLEGLARGESAVTSPLARLAVALDARRRAGGPPLAVVPCDNVPSNGDFVRRGLLAISERRSPDLAAWIADHVSFVSTSVDRITPQTTAADVAALVAMTGIRDEAPVFTEPFSDWVLSGSFPGGRPAWEAAGARFVESIVPFEQRKLTLLNGAHTLLALAGSERGYTTVDEAFSDPRCRDAVERFWSEAIPHLALDAASSIRYCVALAERFANPRIEHRLDQILEGTELKLRYRIVPTVVAELAGGRAPEASVDAIASWVRRHDPARAATLLRRLDPALADDASFVRLVEQRAVAAEHR